MNAQPPHRTLHQEVVFAFALALACYLAWLLREALLELYVSALFAVVLAPVVDAIGRFSIRGWRPFRGWAVLALALGAALAVLLFAALAVPPVVRDLDDFAASAPTRVPVLIARIRTLPFADRVDLAQLSARLQDIGGQAAGFLVSSITNWAYSLVSVIMTVILTVYFLIEGGKAFGWFLCFFPQSERERLRRTLLAAKARMGKWLIGQGTLMLILGVISTIVYLSLGLRYAYALGVVTGVLNIVPVIGVAVSVTLAMLVAMIDSWGHVLAVLVFFLLYLQLENSLLIPRIMRNTVNLPGLAILAGLLIGSEVAGIVGAMVSVPTTVLVSVLVDEYLIRKDGAAA